MPDQMSPNLERGHGGKLIWLLLTAFILVVDQSTKYVADEYLSYARPVEILPFFDLLLVYNKGAAFSFLADAGGWQRWFFAILATAISIVLLVWMYKLKRHETWLAIALALVLGGALGNLYDRVMLGYVIDFVSLHYADYYFPAFNVADSAITAGAIMLVIDALFLSKKHSGDSSLDKSEDLQ